VLIASLVAASLTVLASPARAQTDGLVVDATSVRDRVACISRGDRTDPTLESVS
jgi:hypothetical protein